MKIEVFPSILNYIIDILIAKIIYKIEITEINDLFKKLLKFPKRRDYHLKDI